MSVTTFLTMVFAFITRHKKAILITTCVLLLIAIPFSVQAYRIWRAKVELARLNAEIAQRAEFEAHARKLLKVMRDKMTPEQLRESLTREYKALVEQENPSLNDIEVAADPVPLDVVEDVPVDARRYRIYAQHPFFNKYSFSAGPFGRAVKRWEAEHREELKQARVVYVGVRADSSIYASSAYLDVQ